VKLDLRKSEKGEDERKAITARIMHDWIRGDNEEKLYNFILVLFLCRHRRVC